MCVVESMPPTVCHQEDIEPKGKYKKESSPKHSIFTGSLVKLCLGQGFLARRLEYHDVGRSDFGTCHHTTCIQPDPDISSIDLSFCIDSLTHLD